MCFERRRGILYIKPLMTDSAVEATSLLLRTMETGFAWLSGGPVVASSDSPLRGVPCLPIGWPASSL